MRIVCDFSWGSWTGYFGKKYIPVYDFSGSVAVEEGRLTDTQKIQFAYDDWGPFVRSRQYEPYGKTAFASVVQNWFDGIRVVAEGDENTRLCLRTAMGELCFTAGELWEKKHLSLLVGEPYSMAMLHAEGEQPWYLEDFPPEEGVYFGTVMSGGRERDWFGVRGRAMAPGEELTLCPEGILLAPGTRLQIRLRFLLNGDPNRERQTRDVPHFDLSLNDRPVWSNARFTMYHDVSSQFLEESVIEVEARETEEAVRRLTLRNRDDKNTVLVQLIGLRRLECPPLELAGCPFWAAVERPVPITLRVNALSARVEVDYDPEELEFALSPETINTHPLRRQVADINCIGVNEERVRVLEKGKHTFCFLPRRAGKKVTVTFTDRWSGTVLRVVIPEIWQPPADTQPCHVGAEVRTGNPNDYIPLLERIRDQKIADLVVFRDYHNDSGHPVKLWEAAAFCREYGLLTDAIIMDEQPVVAAASAEHCLCVGTHEHTGIFYGRDRVRSAGYTMKEARDAAVEILRQVADTFRVRRVPVAVGDASGGSRYAYMAGFDILRHETFVGHHMLILPNARGAAKAFGKEMWGVHIASQHNAQPELEYGIRRYYLGVYLAWMMGAGFVFEEDSQFQYFKYNKMVSGDYLPARKTAVMQAFYKYSATHPRRGRPLVDMAVLQGRYAPPVSGLSAANNGSGEEDAFVNENYPVWSHTGNERWSWGYRQCEKGLHLLETLSPGIFLTPLNQQPEKTRKFFSGSPFGEYDFLPVEAPGDVMGDYRLILMLDWHTMEEDGEGDDYHKLLEYVRQGGVLFLSVPHLTTRTDREFLADMDNLRLYAGGDVQALCGVSVRGKSSAALSEIRSVEGWLEAAPGPVSDAIRLPNTDKDEDGPCRLADIQLQGAEPVLIDKDTGRPVLVRHTVGKGWVYLLCTYAYPGHEALKEWMPRVLLRLLDLYGSKRLTLEGERRDVYWSLWGENGQADKVYLLNTDWTRVGNEKQIALVTPSARMEVPVREGAMREISLFEGGFCWAEDSAVSITRISSGEIETDYQVCAMEDTVLRFSASRPVMVTAGEESRVIKGEAEWKLDFPKAEPVFLRIRPVR